MNDFFDGANDDMKENAGLYGAAGGIAGLKNQERNNALLEQANASRDHEKACIDALVSYEEFFVEFEERFNRKTGFLRDCFWDSIDNLVEESGAKGTFNSYYQNHSLLVEGLSGSVENRRALSAVDKRCASLLRKVKPYLDCSDRFTDFLIKEVPKQGLPSVDSIFTSDDSLESEIRASEEFLAGLELFRTEFESLDDGSILAAEFEELDRLVDEDKRNKFRNLFFLFTASSCGFPYDLSANKKTWFLDSDAVQALRKSYSSGSEVFQCNAIMTVIAMLGGGTDSKTYLKWKSLRPVKENEGDDEESTCFVATAVYGDPHHQQVVKLRGYRDETLSKSLIGRSFIRLYYKTGPHLAILPKKSKVIKSILRSLLDRF